MIMKKLILFFQILLAIPVFLFAQNNPESSSDWSKVDAVFGRKGTLIGDVYKVTFPRNDLDVRVNGIKLEAGLALTSWAAYMNMGGTSMVMGDLVLTEDELPAVIKKLSESGILITGIHNHIIGETPAIKYLHYSGMGDEATLSTYLKSALDVTGTLQKTSQPETVKDQTDWSSVEKTLGYKGTSKGDLLMLGIPRNDKIMEMGVEIPPSVGMATSINFQKVDDKALVTGDFVLIAGEVNPVIKELSENGITVTALHNHMLDESPRIFFMHYWGYDDPQKLASGLRKALDKVNVVKSNN